MSAQLIGLWREGDFDLLTAAEQLDQLMRVMRHPAIRARLMPALAGRLVGELGARAIVVGDLPAVTVCPDPHDNFLLAISAAGAADFLVAGDRPRLLAPERHGTTAIVGVGDFLARQRSLR